MRWLRDWQGTQRVIDAGFATPGGRRPPHRMASLLYAGRLALTAPLRRATGRWVCAACGGALPANLAHHACPLDEVPPGTG